MHIAILFYNIGGYHAARLRAAHEVCQQEGWQLTAIQETDSAQEHPWGDLNKEITFPLKTILDSDIVTDVRDRAPQSTVAASQLPAYLNQLQPDILFVPGWGSPFSRAALKWSKSQHVPAILMSESKWDDQPRRWWKEKLKSILYVSHFKSALVGGQAHSDYLAQLGLPKDSIFQGYDVVDNEYFSTRVIEAKRNALKIRQRYPNIPERPYFIAVTRFIARKNVLRLIEAYAQYRLSTTADQSWDLVLCGSGQEEENIRAAIQTHQLENSVHLPGFQSYQDIPNWFGLANAFIHPALSEQWGLVVNEALAAGLPALVSNKCGCYPELIVEQVNGFGFDPSNVNQLADLMRKMSAGEVDLNQMSQSAKAHIQQFSPDAFGLGFKKSVQCVVSAV